MRAGRAGADVDHWVLYGGEDQDADARVRRRDGAGRVDTADAARHLEVHEDEIWREGERSFDCGPAVVGASNDLEVRLQPKQACHSLNHVRLVVREENAVRRHAASFTSFAPSVSMLRVCSLAS